MKKVLSLGLVLSMLLSILPATVSATHWADEDVAYLVENGAIAEDDAMLQNLDTPITRSQMVKVIVALLEGEEPIEGKEYFTDITAEDTHITKAAENGFVNGFGDGTFRPNNPITRQDFFTIVGRAYKLEGTATNEFTDADSIADYAKTYVDALQSIGIVNGYGDGTVNPRGNITIAETLAVMRRTDEHVKANAPEEQPKVEEKPKPKPSGGSGGGGGGFSGGGSTSTPTVSPTATFDIEYAEDFTGEYVAYVTANVTTYNNVELKKAVLLRDGEYHIPPTGVVGGEYDYSKLQKAEMYEQYITEENGKFPIPDFGTYELHMVDADDCYGISTFEVKPPESNDTTAPELLIEVVGEAKAPLTVKITANDDNEIARIDYVKFLGFGRFSDDIEANYKANVNGRVIITEDETTFNYSQFLICAMDTSGNCTYGKVDIDNNDINITDSNGCRYVADSRVPWIELRFSTSNEVNGTLDIHLNIGDNSGVAEKGYFVLPEYYLMATSEEYNTITQKAHIYGSPTMDLSQDIETLISQNGNSESMFVLKNYYDAIQDDSGVDITVFEGDTITLKENGVYFIYAKDGFGNISVLRQVVTNIKRPSVTLRANNRITNSSEYVATITATIDKNKEAPIKQMFLVKSGGEYGEDPPYLKRTTNGEALKVWKAVQESGEYVPVENASVTVPEFGTYSLYVLDEFNNWGVAEVEVKEPAADDVTP